MALTNDIVNGRVVTAGDEVGEKVDHDETFFLGLNNTSSAIFSKLKLE